MLTHYRRTLLSLLTKLRLLQSQPLENLKLCLEIQETLIRKITYFEKTIKACKNLIREYRIYLKTKRPFPLTKDEANVIKSEIEYKQYLIDEYQNLQYLFKTIGDAIAFTNLNK